jgi:hypothetical protein
LTSRKEGRGGWRRLHNDELHDLYSSPNVLRVIKSRSIRWVGHGAHVDKMRNKYKLLVGKTEGKSTWKTWV